MLFKYTFVPVERLPLVISGVEVFCSNSIELFLAVFLSKLLLFHQLEVSLSASPGVFDLVECTLGVYRGNPGGPAVTPLLEFTLC